MATAASIGCVHIHTREFARMAAQRRETEVVRVWDHDLARAEDVARAPTATETRPSRP